MTNRLLGLHIHLCALHRTQQPRQHEVHAPTASPKGGPGRGAGNIVNSLPIIGPIRKEVNKALKDTVAPSLFPLSCPALSSEG